METRTGQSVERQLRNVLVKWVWAWPSGRCPVHNKSTKWRNRRVFLSFGEATAKLIIFKFPAIFTPLQHTHTHTNTTINSNDWPFEIRFFRSEQKWKMLKNKFSTKRGTFFLSKSHKIPATQFRNSGIPEFILLFFSDRSDHSSEWKMWGTKTKWKIIICLVNSKYFSCCLLKRTIEKKNLCTRTHTHAHWHRNVRDSS